MQNSTAPRGPISSSAPPSFRVKKKKPGESNPEPQNNGRMTGPPMQQGAGQGSMFANGRMGNPQGNMPRSPHMPMAGPGPSMVHGQPQYMAPPTPNYPQQGTRMPQGQNQGMHPRGVPTSQPLANGRSMMADGRKPMMADGMGDPGPIGGMPDDQDTAPDMDDAPGGAPEGSAAGEMPIIKPEAVNFHDEMQTCGPMAGGSGCQYFNAGQCSVLQMQVQPQSACTAFEPMVSGSDQGPVDTGAGFAQNDNGTSGSPSLG